jgi:dienelactone hydrolase
VDQRGWGRTGGQQNWLLAVDDTAQWLTWIADQPGVQDGAVAVAGASIGANLAMIACAANPSCYTAIALSPGLDYHGVTPERALVEGLADRSALLAAAHGDTYSARTVTYLAGQTTQGEVGLRLFLGNLHGNAMFSGPYANRLISLINDWSHDF